MPRFSSAPGAIVGALEGAATASHESSSPDGGCRPCTRAVLCPASSCFPDQAGTPLTSATARLLPAEAPAALLLLVLSRRVRLGAPVSPVLQRNAAPAYPRLENRREVTPYQGSIAPAPLEVEKPRTRSRRALPLPLPVAAGPGAEGLSREHAYGNEACYHGQNA